MRGMVLRGAVLLVLVGAALGLALSPAVATAGADSSFVKRSGDTMNGSLRFAGPQAAGITFASTNTGLITIRNAAGNYLAMGTPGTVYYQFAGDSTGLTIQFKDVQHYSGMYQNQGETAAAVTGKTPSLGFALEPETTNGKWRVYEGGAWRFMLTGTTSTGVVQAPFLMLNADCGTGACSEDVIFNPPANYSKAAAGTGSVVHAGTFACSWTVAGTGGTTGVVMQLYNVTDSTEVCSCVVGACTDSVTTPKTCNCDTDVTNFSTKTFAIRMKSTTDCTANPQFTHCSLSALMKP